MFSLCEEKELGDQVDTVWLSEEIAVSCFLRGGEPDVSMGRLR